MLLVLFVSCVLLACSLALDFGFAVCVLVACLSFGLAECMCCFVDYFLFTVV